LPTRFLEPSGFVWGSLSTNDGARLRWGHLPAPEASADCVAGRRFAECIEKYFETIGDLTARGYSV
jgi:alpha-beta hydrolase superfamily lysophospholipase